ncbi:MAG: UDP-N-acetylmuramoyl-L-alanine--D-glutamate ligase [Ignavibacteriales bacterium]|nr:MAG: UDP-N-acetylmuramoyl-L-alanine--D-glutamate ligase [Ignavibacteriales bacterium]
MIIKNKKISIIGAVRSGVAAAKLALYHGAIPFVSDSGSPEKLIEAEREFDQFRIEYEFGKHSEKVFDCDFIVTSPGVPSDSDVLVNAKSKDIPIYSEIEFASWFCEGTIISITGSNGKTTTTTLLNYLLNEAGYISYPAGNIGNALSGIVDKLNGNDFVSLETSSFQLDHISLFKPKFSVILNITPDHLDRYENSFEKYKQAKLRIFENQDENDFLILNADDSSLSKLHIDSKVNRYFFSTKNKVENGAFCSDGKFIFVNNNVEEEICDCSELYIKGEHNRSNALAALIVAKLIGITNEKIKDAFASFKGVEHRLEFVREIEGIKFINDSKATNVDSVWYALQSFDTKILLILGGKDKGNDYNIIKDLVKSKVKKIYAIGSSKDKVYDFFHDIVSVDKKETMEDCVVAGRNEAEANEIVLLSPACASFDMFKNFEHRGEVFKQIVMSLN